MSFARLCDSCAAFARARKNIGVYTSTYTAHDHDLLEWYANVADYEFVVAD